MFILHEVNPKTKAAFSFKYRIDEVGNNLFGKPVDGC
jgi:hypothetical protein